MVTSSRRFGRRRPGEVRDAIEQALAGADAPLHVKEIHAAVEARLGTTVPESSVRSYLNINAGPTGQFEKVRRGIYTLNTLS